MHRHLNGKNGQTRAPNQIAVAQAAFMQGNQHIHALTELYSVICAPIILPRDQNLQIVDVMDRGPRRFTDLLKLVQSNFQTEQNHVFEAIVLACSAADVLRRLKFVIGSRDNGFIEKILAGDPLVEAAPGTSEALPEDEK